MTHPSVYSFVFIQCDCQSPSLREQETDGAVSFIRSKRTQEAVWALQHHVCMRYNLAASVYVSCSLQCFQVSHWKGGRGGRGQQAVTPLRKPFLKELGSAALLRWPPQRLGSEISSKWKEEREDTYVIPCALPSIFCDQVSYTRGFRASLSTAYGTQVGGFWDQNAADAAHPTLQSLSSMSSGRYLTTVTTNLSALSTHSI